ncbi:MAG: hypothetical protein AAGG01_07940 [Planctomycetota bacterium]
MSKPGPSDTRIPLGAAAIRRLARLLGSWLNPGGSRSLDLQIALLVAITWGLLQAYGRALATDEVTDSVAMAACAFFGWSVLRSLDSRAPSLQRRIEDLTARAIVTCKVRLEAAVPRIGVDLVCYPAIPRGLPRLILIPGLASAGLGLIFLVRPFGDGLEIIEFARRWTYPIYLAGLLLFWTLAVMVGIVGLALPYRLAHNRAHSRFRQHDPRRREMAGRWMAGITVAIAAAMMLVPAYWAPPLAALAVLTPALLLQHPDLPRLSVIWRPRDRSAAHRSVEWKTLVLLQDLVGLTVPLALMTAPGLGPLSEAQIDAAPISAALRWFVSFGGLLLAIALGAHRLEFIRSTALAAPSRATPRRVLVEGGTPATRATAEERLRRDGWKILEPSSDDLRSDDTRVVLDPDRAPESPHFVDLRAPIAPSLLTDAEVLWRLKRRADVASRRSLHKGLKAVFKDAAASLRGPGTGYVVAPHQWFMPGLARDVADHDTTEGRSMQGFLQPDFSAVMTPRARHHLYLVLSSLGVDLIYVEDGVGFRRLSIALRVMFEVFDRHGVDRRIRTSDFSSVHGVHAILHEVAPDEPRDSELYPESDYASETRARVLHLYRDRGGEDEKSEAPVETDDIPLLV